MAAMAEHEREMISERTQAAIDAARREIALNGFRIRKTGRRFSTFGNRRWWESIAKARAANLSAPPRSFENTVSSCGTSISMVVRDGK
jgi:DNA invertase Pin-like site-specific DNA recombinase